MSAVAETRALTRLAFEELSGATGGIGDVHRAIAGRVFAGVGPGAAPVRATHDAIAGAVYAGLGGAVTVVGRGAETALGLRAARAARPLSESPGGALALGILAGLRGDALERDASPLHQPMAVRVDGRPIAPEPQALATAFSDATGRLVVFLHGLMETEQAWGHGGGETYGSRLSRDLGFTAVDVRYNSGRHISENGRSLAELLEAVVCCWPVEVDQLALVGHSMGGLVARSACRVGREDAHTWVGRVRHVVSLGSPHFGAPLEQAVLHASAALYAVPEMQPLARFLRRRSAGIRDLRHGSLVDEDWRDRDPDALRSAACAEVPLLDGATHCFVAATVTRSPRHLVGRLLGDLLVLEPSASGRSRTRRIGFADEHGMHLGGATHFALLNHPAVYEKLRAWLAATPAPTG